MGKEIWIWIKEKASAFFRWVTLWIKRGWLVLTSFMKSLSASAWRRIAVAIPLIFIFYILIGIGFTHRIDDEPIDLSSKPAGGANVIAVMATLVEREAVDHRWTPNDPFFMPGWWIDNTPSYQTGIMNALSRVSLEMRDQLGRSRGSSAVDTDLEGAAGNLAKEPDRWIINFSTSFLPTTASEKYYAEAAEQLKQYNHRLAAGEAVFERRTDNLLATLDRIALDLGASSAVSDGYIAKNAGGFLPDRGADDIFYRTKGQSYAYTEVLKALRVDFTDLIETREITTLFDELIRSMEAVVTLNPTVVANGSRDGILANHLATQGFHLLRARTQMREITNILLK